MSDIDDDVWEQAKDTFQRHCQFSIGMTLDYAESMAKRAIASAIQKERERCAKIAETEGVYPELNVFAGGPEWYKHGKRIASAIRTPGRDDGE